MRTNRFIKNLFLSLLVLSAYSVDAQPFNPQQLQQQDKAVDEFLAIKHALIDSLTKEIQHTNDTAKIDCLIQLYLAQLVLGTKTAFQSLERAESLAKKIKYYKGEAKCLENKANYYMETKNLLLAEKYLRMATALYKAHHYDDEYYDALQVLGYLLYWKMKFKDALKIYDTTYQYFKQFPQDPKNAYTFRRMGMVLDAQGRYEEAFSWFMKDMNISKNMKDRKGSRKSYIIFSNFYLGNMYLQAGDKKNALLYLKISAEKAMENIMPDVYDHHMGDIHFMLNNYDSARYYYLLEEHCWSRTIKDTAFYQQVQPLLNVPIAKTYVAQQQYDTAIVLLESALIYYSDNIFANDIYKYLSRAYEGKRNYSKALQYSRELLKIANASGARPFVKEAAEMHWKLFDHMKQTDSAYKYLNLYASVSDTLSADKQLRNIAALEWKNADELHQSELIKEKIVNTKQKQLMLLGLATFALASFFIVRHSSLRRKHERIKRLQIEQELTLQKAEKDKTHAEYEKQTAELKMQALRAQMNPHFIFNSLNSINSFILKNNKTDASRYLTKFSRLVRLMLHHSQSSQITLQEEIDALILYIELEQLRFHNHFNYTIQVPQQLDTTTYMVPPLIIQPFVENAIWHGLMHKESEGSLKIEFHIEDKTVYCKISDDGVGRKKTEELKQLAGNTYKSVGMSITKERISRMIKNDYYTEPVEIIDSVLSDGSSGGTIVIIKLPGSYD